MTVVRDTSEPGHGWRFRLAGFTVTVPLNALIGVLVIALLWYPEFAGSAGLAGQWVLAGVFAVLLMVSILGHELAHGYAARAFHYPVSGITLWAMGGFTSYRTTAKHGPFREAVIALAGPAATLAIALVAWLASRSVGGLAFDLLAALASANFLIGFFNLLPGAPLDGGAVVKAIVWAATGSAVTGQVVAAWVGRVLAALILVSPFLLALQVGGTPSLTLILVAVVLAWVLWSGASASLKQAAAARTLAAVTAGDLAVPMVAVPAALPVSAVLPDLRPDRALVVTDEGGRARAVVVAAAAQAVPPEARDRISVAAVTASVAADAPVLPPQAPATDVVAACQATGSRFVFVVAPGIAARLIDTDAAFVTEGP